jgi:hypothetical protein
MANRLIGEILKEINEDVSAIKNYETNSYLRNVFEHAFMPEKRFLLPEGIPPYKAQLGPAQQHEMAFFMEAKKFYVYCRQDLKPIKREQMFINCLEALSDSEAKIFIAIKEQTLSELYPNITLESLKAIGYFK